MRITYANKRVERFFEDYGEMKKRIPLEWVKAIKKHVDRLQAAPTFGDFLKLNLGHPEALKGKDSGKYSLRVNANVRLIMEPNEQGDAVMISEEIRMEGVVDYHGGKETWFIP
ncbi:MAG: type II toxin-antitoxin system RelE/ParE family toxin [Eggerthellaceae bacterium]|nr:type II toxin-antitoxin system RelE/ParE family toxin [Eggerthellaceae bacterium]